GKRPHRRCWNKKSAGSPKWPPALFKCWRLLPERIAQTRGSEGAIGIGFAVRLVRDFFVGQTRSRRRNYLRLFFRLLRTVGIFGIHMRLLPPFFYKLIEALCAPDGESKN